jgi:hypothetical protein
MRTSWIVIVVGLVGCSKDRPKLTQDKMPATLKAATLGKTTEAEILASYPNAEIRKMNFNGVDSHEIRVESPSITFTTKPPTKDGVVYRISLGEANICDWVKTQVDPLEGSTNCPGNRKTGISSGGSYHCMDMPDGTLVGVECRAGQIPVSALDLWAHY